MYLITSYCNTGTCNAETQLCCFDVCIKPDSQFWSNLRTPTSSLPRSFYCLVTQRFSFCWGGALRDETKTAARETNYLVRKATKKYHGLRFVRSPTHTRVPNTTSPQHRLDKREKDFKKNVTTIPKTVLNGLIENSPLLQTWKEGTIARDRPCKCTHHKFWTYRCDAHLTQWSFHEFMTTAGPRERAGFILAPEEGI